MRSFAMTDRTRKPSGDKTERPGDRDAKIEIEGYKTVDPADLDDLPDIPGFRPQDRENLVELVPDPEGELANLSIIKPADGEDSEGPEAVVRSILAKLAKDDPTLLDRIVIKFDEDDEC
jgi:hypothetical protein